MENVCIGCRSDKVVANCGVCSAELCRKCRVFLSEEDFIYLVERPEDLRHTYYCASCEEEKLIPFREEYEATLEQAKGVMILFKGSKSTVRVLRKASETLEIRNSIDRDVTILRMAFAATRLGFNSLIEVELESQKVRNEGWQKTAWSGKGVPADVRSYRDSD